MVDLTLAGKMGCEEPDEGRGDLAGTARLPEQAQELEDELQESGDHLHGILPGRL